MIVTVWEFFVRYSNFCVNRGNKFNSYINMSELYLYTLTLWKGIPKREISWKGGVFCFIFLFYVYNFFQFFLHKFCFHLEMTSFYWGEIYWDSFRLSLIYHKKRNKIITKEYGVRWLLYAFIVMFLTSAELWDNCLVCIIFIW